MQQNTKDQAHRRQRGGNPIDNAARKDGRCGTHAQAQAQEPVYGRCVCALVQNISLRELTTRDQTSSREIRGPHTTHSSSSSSEVHRHGRLRGSAFWVSLFPPTPLHSTERSPVDVRRTYFGSSGPRTDAPASLWRSEHPNLATGLGTPGSWEK